MANCYIVLVAPAGIVSKSTTADMAMNLLREVPGIKFGPSVVTWQALVTAVAEACEEFQIGKTLYKQSPITIVSSEFGNLLNPKDKDMVDMLVNLWDGRPFVKATKLSGVDNVINPWINIIACTTPDWIAGYVPEYMVGGGFTSRCIFVFAESKAKYVPYPALATPPDIATAQEALIHDLEHISVNVCGPYTLTPEALVWGSEWYQRHWTTDTPDMDPLRFGGYLARKQTHAHKLAMVIAAAKRDEPIIVEEDLRTAVAMLTDLEPDMAHVFEKIGMPSESIQADRVAIMIRKAGRLPIMEVVRHMNRYFVGKAKIDDVLQAGFDAGMYHLDPATCQLVAGPKIVSVYPASAGNVLPLSR